MKTPRKHLLAREGLRRLLQAVAFPHLVQQHPAARDRRIRLCLAFTQGVSPHTFLAVNEEELVRKVKALRPLVQLPKGRHYTPMTIAQQYLEEHNDHGTLH